MKPQQIIGHDAQRAALLQDIEKDNVAHAYIFVGPSHVGKMTIAKWFAGMLLSQGREDAEKVHHDIAHMIHPDVLVLDALWQDGVMDKWEDIAKYSNVPQLHRSKAKLKTDAIGIDDVRAIRSQFYETGTGKWRCCCIRNIERMQAPAANALLKILEEPPPGRVFLLTTNSLGSLLPTIVSRARVVHFSRVPDVSLQPILEGQEENDAKFIRHLAQGCPGRVLSFMKDPEMLREQRTVHSDAAAFWTAKNSIERIRTLEPLLKRGEKADEFLMHLALTLREQSEYSPEWAGHLTNLIRTLRTNTHRELAVQQFALRVYRK